MSDVRVRDILAAVDAAMPFAWAESWDRVGLLAGDPDAVVTRVFATLDPTPGALKAAIDAGAQVLLTHHPAFLEAPERLVPAQGMAGVAYSAVAAGVALIAAHTNLDRCPEGAEALPAALGLRSVAPLESSGQPVTTLVAYVPPAAVPEVLRALETAGAGRIGRYEGCSFTAQGTGHFTPLSDAAPTIGTPGEAHAGPEVRIEVVCAPEVVAGALAAVRAVHPYEEPVVLTGERMLDRGAARMGRVCEVGVGSTLASVAERVSRRLGVRATVWGDPSAVVTLAGVAPGSGRSLVPAARAAGCDVIVTGELRYHEALDAMAAGLAVIEAGHDATEWPLVPVLARAAGQAGLPAGAIIIDRPSTNWWTTEGA